MVSMRKAKEQSASSRSRYSTGSKYEEIASYSRAVKVGNLVYLSGTTAFDEKGQLVGAGDVYAQTKQALRNIERGLTQAGATTAHIVKTTAYITDMSRWREYAKAYSEVFKETRPASTLVEVKGLVDPGMLIEIEGVAVF